MTHEMKLLKDAIDGNVAAFEQIVLKYQSLVCAITFSGSGRQDISEELAQETFLSAWKNLRQLTDPAGFRFWLCTIARNMVNSYYRRKKTHPLDPTDCAQLSDTNPSPSEQLISQEEHVMLEQALLRIPTEYREPLVMYYRQEKSIREVALAMEMNESTVRTRLHRARQMLRDEIAARLERTLEKTAPDKTFTNAVMAAIGTTVIGMAGSTKAASTSNTAGTGATVGSAATASAVTAKIITIAAVIAVAVGSAFIYKHLSNPDQTPVESDEIAVLLTNPDTAAAISDIPETIPPTPAEQIVKEPITAPIIEPSAVNAVVDTPSPPNIDTKPALLTLTPGIPKNSEYVFEPNGILSGQITDAKTGQPVTDAEIELSISRIYTARTDENGFYSFEKIDQPGSYRIKVRSASYIGITDFDKLPMIYLEQDSREVKHFKLEKACLLDVWVVDEKDDPLESAEVYATWLADSRRQLINDSIYEKKTDADGYMMVGGFAPAESPYLITVMHSREEILSEDDGIRFIKKIPNYACAGQKIVLNDPNIIQSTKIVLKKGTKVRGYAEYLDGVPASGLNIIAHPDWWHCTFTPGVWAIEPNGFFTLEQIVPDTYDLQVTIPTGESTSIGKPLFSTQLPPPEGQLLKVTIPEKSPHSLASIYGTIEFIGDNLPRSVSISAYSQEHGNYYTQYDRNIRGTFPDHFLIDRMKPGTYRLQFSGIEIEPVTIENVQVPCDDIDVKLYVIAKPRLTGTVVDAHTSQPVTHFKARAKKLKTLRSSNYGQRDQWVDFRNNQGAFDIEAAGPGIYQVQIASEGYAQKWSPQINTDENQPTQIQLDAGGGISGKVINTDSGPVKNATVTPLSLAGGLQLRTADTFVSTDGAVQTDTDGRFSLSYLPSGIETLKVSHPDYAFEIVENITVRTGRTTEIASVVLGKGAAIEGIVYDTLGKAEQGVLISVDDTRSSASKEGLAHRLGMAVTDPNGFYRIDHLPEMTCYMQRQYNRTPMGVVRRTVIPQYGKTSRVDFGGKAKLTGQIILDGVPLVNERIQLSPTGESLAGTYNAYTTTNSDGIFTFYPGVNGSYTIYCRRSRDWSPLADVLLSANQDMDVGMIPKKASTLQIYINQPSVGPLWETLFLSIQKNKNGIPWTTTSPRVASLETSPNDNQPYELQNLLPGSYCLQLTCSDNQLYRVPVRIDDTQPLNELEINLPPADCKLDVLTGPAVPVLCLSTTDGSFLMELLPYEEGKFHADAIPAGNYRISIAMPYIGQVPGELFELKPSEAMTLDLTGSLTQIPNISYVIVQTVDENGSLTDVDELWLEIDNQKIWPTNQNQHLATFHTIPGDYTLQIRKSGYKDITMPVSIKPFDLNEKKIRKRENILIRLEKR